MNVKYLLLVFMIISLGCYKDKRELLYPENNCDTTNVTFVKDIQASMNQSCATSGCHQGAVPAAGINLANYAGVKIIVDNGALMGTVNHNPGFSPMPKNAAKLSACEISKINAWINKGALNN